MIKGDPVEPGAKGRVTVKPSKSLIYAKKDLLSQVISLLTVTADAKS
jgi:hypothetical protein